MMCEKCQKNPASVHMQQFIHGTKKEMHLCQECSFKLDNIPISLETIFQGFLEQMKHFGQPGNHSTEPQTLTCTRCGMAYNEFKKDGKLGCDSCYQAFHSSVTSLIKNVQGSTRHGGKFPQRAGAELLQLRQIDELRTNLKAAIAEENFEEAARLRDEIREMEGANT